MGKKTKGYMDEVFAKLDSGRIKSPKTREYIGLENAMANAERKKLYAFIMSRKVRKKKRLPRDKQRPESQQGQTDIRPGTVIPAGK